MQLQHHSGIQSSLVDQDVNQLITTSVFRRLIRQLTGDLKKLSKLTACSTTVPTSSVQKYFAKHCKKLLHKHVLQRNRKKHQIHRQHKQVPIGSSIGLDHEFSAPSKHQAAFHTTVRASYLVPQTFHSGALQHLLLLHLISGSANRMNECTILKGLSQLRGAEQQASMISSFHQSF